MGSHSRVFYLFCTAFVLVTLKHVWQGKRAGYNRQIQPRRFWIEITIDVLFIAAFIYFGFKYPAQDNPIAR
jgi:hypothetical protein